WLFTGGTCVPKIGQGETGCSTDGQNDEELLAVLPNLNVNVCNEINKRLNISPTPSGGSLSTSKFTGTFTKGDMPSGVDGLNGACITYGGNYYFYYVLLAR